MYQNFSRTFGQSDLINFYWGPVSASADSFSFTWTKPSTCHFVYFLIIGGGGGGGGGGSSAAATIGAGGAGGTAGTVSHALFSAFVIPDTLAINVGSGGTGGTGQVQGGAAATAGNNGGPTYISFKLGTNNGTSTFLYSPGGPGGGLGSGSTPGTGSSNSVNSSQALCTLGLFSNLANSNSGGSGGSSGASGNITVANVNTSCAMVCPGVGGAGVNAGTTTANSGQIVFNSTTITPSIAGGLAGGGNGINGYDFFGMTGQRDIPMFSTGATGGGSNTLVGTGGNGGNGGTGSGGGGGGGTNGVSAIGGAGGNGGPGLVIIQCW